MTPLQKHIEQWKNCRKCDLCKVRHKIVLGRGSIPADVCFVGEAPGASEDTLGQPFVGPAGMLLDRIIERSLPQGMKYAINNLVACIPRDPEDGLKAGQPLPEEIETCSPRLIEFVELVNPKLIVCVGTLARDYLDPMRAKGNIRLRKQYPRIVIDHPAYILRMNVAQKGLAVQRAIVTVKTAIEDFVTNPASQKEPIKATQFKPHTPKQKFWTLPDDNIPF